MRAWVNVPKAVNRLRHVNGITRDETHTNSSTHTGRERWRCSVLADGKGRLDAVEAAVRPTLLCGVNAIPPNPSQLPCAQRHPMSKRVRRGCRRPATANATLTESDKLTPPASETHYEATTIRTARHWPKDRRADRWIGVEGPQTDPP